MNANIIYTIFFFILPIRKSALLPLKIKLKRVDRNFLVLVNTFLFYFFYLARPSTFASFANSSRERASPLTDGENPHSAIAASIVSFSNDNPS